MDRQSLWIMHNNSITIQQHPHHHLPSPTVHLIAWNKSYLHIHAFAYATDLGFWTWLIDTIAKVLRWVHSQQRGNHNNLLYEGATDVSGIWTSLRAETVANSRSDVGDFTVDKITIFMRRRRKGEVIWRPVNGKSEFEESTSCQPRKMVYYGKSVTTTTNQMLLSKWQRRCNSEQWV